MNPEAFVNLGIVIGVFFTLGVFTLFGLNFLAELFGNHAKPKPPPKIEDIDDQYPTSGYSG